MPEITLRKARTIIARTLAKGREMELKPLSVIVLDAGGNVKAFEREDGASNLRFQMAHGKAYGALGVGQGSRYLMTRAEKQPYFTDGLGTVFGAILPVPGGVLVKDRKGNIIGAVGVTGDTSDNDEAAALAGIEAAGFTGDGG
ncbi:heme-binding protein [Limibaculum sp. FT325]|uniref:GlcG/HbpS family heme-binding protein n=1 Tax=Thermohalobaculum sediminis TaxID=2939436 RepID=UPI0020BF4184|nr:heme-binding protein [Limibaculum sediminis]MCL5775652.1 heme-binding protein [Limibaculum sediminis]